MGLKGRNLSVHYGWIITVTIFLVSALVKMTWLVADNTATIKKTSNDDAYIMSTILPSIVNEIKDLKVDVNIIHDRQNIVYERMSFRDSVYKIFQNQVLRKFEISDKRDTRIENYLNLKHLEYQNDNSLRNKEMKPFGKIFIDAPKQLTLK
jgi:hypothetical protein